MPVNWFEQAIADIGAAVEDAVDWVEQAAEDVGDVIEDVAQAVVDVVEDVAGDVRDALEDIADVALDVVEDVGEALEDAAEWTLNTLDDYVFDPVDYITGGVIDIDYDDGQFSAALDIGVASVGISVGEAGFSAEASFDVGLARGEISYDSADGLAMSGSLGVDWGPLPYAEGHLTISPDGDVSIGGRLQATLPLPFGEIGGQVSGGFERGADGSWGAYADAELHASGFFGSVGLDTDTSIDVDADGDFTFQSDFSASATGPLGAHASVDSSTTITKDGDDLSATFITDAEAGILDVEVRGGSTIRGELDDNGASLDAEIRAGVTAFGADTDVSGRVAHDRGFDGTVTDVLTGEVVTTTASGDTSALGATVAATRGPGGSSVDTDAWFDTPLDDATGSSGSTNQALLPGDAPTDATASDAGLGVVPDVGAPGLSAVPGAVAVGLDDASGLDAPGLDDLPDLPDLPDVPAPEPPPSDFSQEIAAIDSVEAESDALWDDLGQ
jgi:hypothetical protein